MKLKKDQSYCCTICGFITKSETDMIEHLTGYINMRNYKRIPDENCTKKIIKVIKK